MSFRFRSVRLEKKSQIRNMRLMITERSLKLITGHRPTLAQHTKHTPKSRTIEPAYVPDEQTGFREIDKAIHLN